MQPLLGKAWSSRKEAACLLPYGRTRVAAVLDIMLYYYIIIIAEGDNTRGTIIII